MKNRFKQYSDSTLRSFNKEQLIEYIRLLQENLQTLAIRTERVVEVNIKAFEYVSDEKQKEILKELSQKWEDDEKDEIR
nr:MAG TPA: hypothetical protein [Caudoviricetes sp.]